MWKIWNSVMKTAQCFQREVAPWVIQIFLWIVTATRWTQQVWGPFTLDRNRKIKSKSLKSQKILAFEVKEFRSLEIFVPRNLPKITRLTYRYHTNPLQMSIANQIWQITTTFTLEKLLLTTRQTRLHLPSSLPDVPDLNAQISILSLKVISEKLVSKKTTELIWSRFRIQFLGGWNKKISHQSVTWQLPSNRVELIMIRLEVASRWQFLHITVRSRNLRNYPKSQKKQILLCKK